MEESAYITSVIAGAFYVIVGSRLLGLSRRTGERPEFLLGCYFALSGAYYLVYNLPSPLGLEAWSAAAEWIVEWIYVLGVFPYLLFIRSVFRPEHGWAGAFVGICSILLLAGTIVGSLDGRSVYSLENPWFLVQWVGYTAPCVWLGCESLLSRQSARKRVRIGLCAPIVANRYLLFALFGGFQALACLADLVYAADLDRGQTVSPSSDALLGSSEIASIAVLWLAFFPPRFYADWISRRAATSSTPMDG